MPLRKNPATSTSALPAALLTELWEKYCSGALLNCGYDHAAVSDVWESFGDTLARAPMYLASAQNAATSVELRSADKQLVSWAALQATGQRPKQLLVLVELSWDALDESQRQSLLDVPLTLFPILNFLKAVAECQMLPQPAASQSATAMVSGSTIQCAVRGGPTLPFERLGANMISRLVFVRGTVVRLSSPKVQCRVMPFRCVLCGVVSSVDVDGGPLVYPTTCSGRCRGSFQPMLEEAATEEVQCMKIQEDHENEKSEKFSADGSNSNYANRVAEIELRGVFMDTANAGDKIVVCGIVWARRSAEGGKQHSGMRQLVLRAVSLTCVGTHQSRRLASKRGVSGLSNLGAYEKMARFFEMAKHPQWYERLVNSLCPGIVGMREVKQALLLALAGGSHKPHMRSNIHVLLVGDPGLGKSQLLRAAAAVAPRSSMATATTSTSCGLTITLSRDPQTGETTYEAGAVIHGDGGVTCIDELDKGSAEHKALLEVMEQGTLSIAKAGSLFSMPVDTSIIAAGNPIGGKFQFTAGKSISQNLNISAALLSRFDAIFLLHDGMRRSADTTPSDSVTTHVLQLHRQGRSDTASHAAQLLSLDTMTEFLQFARETCKPTMTVGPATVLRDAYLDMRKKFAHNKCDLPVTPRYLQALIRLSEARAKLELRQEVLTEDAHLAIALLSSGTDGYRIAAEAALRSGTPTQHNGGATSGVAGGKKASQKDVAIMNMQRILDSRGGGVGLTHDEVVSCCADAGCKNPNQMVQQLNEYGTLLLSGGRYRLKTKLP